MSQAISALRPFRTGETLRPVVSRRRRSEVRSPHSLSRQYSLQNLSRTQQPTPRFVHGPAAAATFGAEDRPTSCREIGVPKSPLSGISLEDFNKTPQANSRTMHSGGQGEQFDWNECWYPTFYTCDLDKKVPQAVTVLGKRLVIWWDASASEEEARQQGLDRAWSAAKTSHEAAEVGPGCWRAFRDLCPHRLAPLSEGRINEEGDLECPYHGWSFDGCGTCVSIPQLPQGT
ncbi:hypothetical protein CYMTET_45420 [Cymbomonas tetramitiformis]|uniref:Rieske domain-containing protein n=1 Tax=Cymbomonas tetramitiformis TaxID=36881 RepID=A0AAE0BY89_9CHLO|nr:hypothetical protein CYMTET_45420 [Cymbomonas tetramitiformis]